MKAKLTAFGRYLHYIQDIYSHRDYPDPWGGHGVEILRGRPHMPDKTYGFGETPILETIRDFMLHGPIFFHRAGPPNARRARPSNSRRLRPRRRPRPGNCSPSA